VEVVVERRGGDDGDGWWLEGVNGGAWWLKILPLFSIIKSVRIQTYICTAQL
jgi:hypothetical protein